MAVVRYREKNGDISRKHGNSLIRTLRKTYGPNFAKGFANDEKLSDVLATLDEPSLTRLIHDHEAGNLEAICREERLGGSLRTRASGWPLLIGTDVVV